ncbi:MAG: hypothetical protein DRO40_02515 [Thermoprotei archaeon]|nr:MAG: hypothetical protein DRO40_02515 [Thermoprotei archaeon]
MSKEDVIGMAKRMKQAFKHVQCFVVEKQELQLAKKAINEIGLFGLVRVRLADPKYPLLYVIEPDLRDCEKDCEKKALKAIAEGRVKEELKKQFLVDFIRQCLNFCEHERVKEILSRIEEYIRGKGGKSTKE